MIKDVYSVHNNRQMVVMGGAHPIFNYIIILTKCPYGRAAENRTRSSRTRSVRTTGILRPACTYT